MLKKGNLERRAQKLMKKDLEDLSLEELNAHANEVAKLIVELTREAHTKRDKKSNEIADQLNSYYLDLSDMIQQIRREMYFIHRDIYSSRQ